LHSLRLTFRAQVQDIHGSRQRTPAACSKSWLSHCSSLRSSRCSSQRSCKSSHMHCSSHTSTSSSSDASSGRDSNPATTPATATATTSPAMTHNNHWLLQVPSKDYLHWDHLWDPQDLQDHQGRIWQPRIPTTLSSHWPPHWSTKRLSIMLPPMGSNFGRQALNLSRKSCSHLRLQLQGIPQDPYGSCHDMWLGKHSHIPINTMVPSGTNTVHSHTLWAGHPGPSQGTCNHVHQCPNLHSQNNLML